VAAERERHLRVGVGKGVAEAALVIEAVAAVEAGEGDFGRGLRPGGQPVEETCDRECAEEGTHVVVSFVARWEWSLPAAIRSCQASETSMRRGRSGAVHLRRPVRGAAHLAGQGFDAVPVGQAPAKAGLVQWPAEEQFAVALKFAEGELPRPHPPGNLQAFHVVAYALDRR